MNNLAKYRAKHGLTQEQLGKTLGLTKAGVSYLEKSKLSVNAAKKCAEALGESPLVLLGQDVLKMLPKNEEEKAFLLDVVKGL